MSPRFIAIMIAISTTLNFVAAILVLRASIRNYIMHGENLSMAEKIGKCMTVMKQLRDLLADDLEDLSTVGDAHKEGKHGIH